MEKGSRIDQENKKSKIITKMKTDTKRIPWGRLALIILFLTLYYKAVMAIAFNGIGIVKKMPEEWIPSFQSIEEIRREEAARKKQDMYKGI